MKSYLIKLSTELNVEWERSPVAYHKRTLIPELVKHAVKRRVKELGLSEDDRLLIHHVLNSWYNEPWYNEMYPGKIQGDWVAVPKELRHEAFRNADVENLVGLRVLDCDYTKQVGKCYRYRIADQEILDAIAMGCERLASIFLSKKPKYKVVKQGSEFIQKAADGIPYGLVNKDAAFEYLRREMHDLEFDGEYGARTARDVRYRTDLCYLNQVVEALNSKGQYPQTFKTQEVGGRLLAASGDQMISRELKAHWFNIPDVRNYDLKKCHVAALLSVTPTPTDFLYQLVTNVELTPRLMGELGIKDKDQFKKAQIALIYGAGTTGRKGSAVREALGGDRELTNQFIAKHQGLITSMNAYREFLKTDRKTKEGRYTNLVGLQCPKEKDRADYWKKNYWNTVMSHMLTGIEGRIIFNLCSKKFQQGYNYQVISNQFDGLVTIGIVPPEAVEEAKIGLAHPEYFRLDEKPFV